MANYYSSYEKQIRTFINDKENIFDGISKELQRDKLISSVKNDFNEMYNSIKFNSTLHVINILCNYREKMKEHLDFVHSLIYDKHESIYYPIYSFFNKKIKFFAETMENIYKQNKDNKKVINRVKIFTKKRKLCNDIRNIIISFLITPPKIYSTTNI